jgi:4-hydroxybenzoate polyprenyltransferase
MTIVREIIKDMEDLKGDDTFGCKTLPIIWGLRKTKFFIYAIMALFVIVVVWINFFYVKLPEMYFLIFLAVPMVILLVTLIRADTKKDFSQLSTFCKLILLLGVISMAFV